MTSETQTKTREANVEQLINSYENTPKQMVNITYKSPSYAPDSPIARSFEKVRDKERDLTAILSERRSVDRKMLVEHGYEDVPVWFRGLEAARRYIVSVATNGEGDAEKIAEYAKRSNEHLGGLIHKLETTIPEYERAKTKVKAYKHELEDRMIEISRTRSDVGRRLETLTYAIKTHEERRDTSAAIEDRVKWKRAYEAMEDDKRSLQSLEVRATNDFNQTMDLEMVAGLTVKALDAARTMNEIASMKARSMQAHLGMNLDLYATNSSVTDIAASVGTELNKASKLSELLTRSTKHRMEALTTITRDFSMPNGKGAASIAGGGLLDGLYAHLEEMRSFAQEELDEKLERY